MTSDIYVQSYTSYKITWKEIKSQKKYYQFKLHAFEVSTLYCTKLNKLVRHFNRNGLFQLSKIMTFVIVYNTMD